MSFFLYHLVYGGFLRGCALFMLLLRTVIFMNDFINFILLFVHNFIKIMIEK